MHADYCSNNFLCAWGSQTHMECEIDQQSKNNKLKRNDNVYQKSSQVYYKWRNYDLSYCVMAESKTAPGCTYSKAC